MFVSPNITMTVKGPCNRSILTAKKGLKQDMQNTSSEINKNWSGVELKVEYKYIKCFSLLRIQVAAEAMRKYFFIVWPSDRVRYLQDLEGGGQGLAGVFLTPYVYVKINDFKS